MKPPHSGPREIQRAFDSRHVRGWIDDLWDTLTSIGPGYLVGGVIRTRERMASTEAVAVFEDDGHRVDYW